MEKNRNEEPLKGGRVTPGVVRVGETVRRPQSANGAFVHQVLRHLAAKGRKNTPAFLGTDEKDREILSYLPGEVPDNIGWFSDAACRRELSGTFTGIWRISPARRQGRPSVIGISPPATSVSGRGCPGASSTGTPPG